MVETLDGMSDERRILIVGVSGMLGADLAPELRRTWSVFGADQAEPARKLPLVDFVRADISDPAAIDRMINSFLPAVVIHAAAWTDVDGCESDPARAMRVNGEGTRNVAASCKSGGAALVYLSTDFVFDGNSPRAYRETDQTGPLSVYGQSKLAGEHAVAEALKRHFIVRTSWLFGSHGKNFVDTIAAKAQRKETLQVVNDQVGSPTYTKDLSVALDRLLSSYMKRDESGKDPGYGIYHIANKGSVSWYAYAKAIIEIAEIEAPLSAVSSSEYRRPAKRPAMSTLDTSKYVAYAGHRLRKWQDALTDYIVNEKRRYTHAQDD